MKRLTIDERLERNLLPIDPQKREQLKIHRARLRQLVLVEKRPHDDPEVEAQLKFAREILDGIDFAEKMYFLLLDPKEQEKILNPRSSKR